MKKKVLFVAALFIGATTFAQDGLTSKKGEAFLPEAGDFAIGFDGQSFVDYFGNLASGNDAHNSLSFNNSYNTFYGKMFKDENTAYRGQVRIGMSSTSMDILHSGSTGDSLTDNVSTSNGFTFIVGAGLEKRRGSGRLQGVYGAQLLFGMIGGASTTNEYGQALDPLVASGPRTLENNGGSTMTFGLNGFAGVEYFILPKFSLGAEVNWGLGFGSTGEGEIVTESSDGVAVTQMTSKSGGNSSFSLDNSAGANFKVMFHF